MAEEKAGLVSRLGASIKGLIVGLVVVAAGGGVLFWNETQAVKNSATLASAFDGITKVSAGEIDEANADKLIHVTGEVTAEGTLRDVDFQVSAEDVLKLIRTVEMYQWSETTTNGETTYQKIWSKTHLPSSKFKEQEGHANPEAMRFEPKVFVAEDLSLGAYKLSDRLVESLDKVSPLQVEAPPEGMVAGLSQPGESLTLTQHDGGYYASGNGGSSSEPKIGDCKIRFEVVRPDTVTVVGRQVDSSFAEFELPTSNFQETLKYGAVEPSGMHDAESEDKTLIQVLRGVAGVLILIGLWVVFKRLRPVAALVPVFGGIAELATPIVAVGLTAGLALLTGSAPWLIAKDYRVLPHAIGGAVLVLLLFYLGFRKRRRRKLLERASAYT